MDEKTRDRYSSIWASGLVMGGHCDSLRDMANGQFGLGLDRVIQVVGQKGSF